jgi:hypothetical protein
MGQAELSHESVRGVIKNLCEESRASGRKPYHLAYDRLEACRNRNDTEGMRFWRNVWIQLMTEEYKPLSIPVGLGSQTDRDCY